MVRLLSLQAHNFKKLRLDTPIRFRDGITLISGLNESGKSSVLDAILYALFGRVTRPPRAKNEDLVTYGAKEATVVLDFEVGARSFRITRKLHKLKPTRALLEELKTSKGFQPLATGQEKANEEIVRLLGGITYQEIVSSTVVAQKELDKLIKSDKDDRRRVINAFLNLDSFNTVITDLEEERRDLEGTGSRVGRVQTEREKLELLKSELLQFKRNSEEKTMLLNENLALTDTVKDLQTKFQDKDRLYNDLRKREAMLKTRDNLTLQLSGKKKQFDDYQLRAEQLSEEIDGVQQELSRFALYDKIEPLLSKLGDEVGIAKTQLIELSASERSVKAMEEEIGELERKQASIDELKIRERTAQLQKPIRPYAVVSILLFTTAFATFTLGLLPIALALALTGVAPAVVALTRVQAATSLGKVHSMLGDLRYLDSKRRELVTVKGEYKQAKERCKSTEQDITALCESLSVQGAMFNSSGKLGGLEAAQAILQASVKERQTREALRVKLQTLSDETRKLPSKASLVVLKKEIKDLELQLGQLAFPPLAGGIVFRPELIAETLSARDELSRQLATAHSRIQQNLRRIDDLDKYLSEHADLPTNVQTQEMVVHKLERQLGVVRNAVEGVQETAESLRDRVRPVVQGYMSSILPALTSSRYRAAILDDEYNLQVWDPEAGEYRPKEVYSGGAEDQFLLAMRLAFALALLPEAKGQKPEFVFLDEPLGSSDEIRRSGIVDYLAQDLSRKFKQIFIISHVGGLEEQVQNIITLDDGMVA